MTIDYDKIAIGDIILTRIDPDEWVECEVIDKFGGDTLKIKEKGATGIMACGWDVHLELDKKDLKLNGQH